MGKTVVAGCEGGRVQSATAARRGLRGGLWMALIVGHVGMAMAQQSCPPELPSASASPVVRIDDCECAIPPSKITIYQRSTLSTKAADFDRDGDLDVVTGGNGAPWNDQSVPQTVFSVKVTYLQNTGPQQWGIAGEDRLEHFIRTSNCYDLAVADFDNVNGPDIAVGRLLNSTQWSFPFNQRSGVFLNNGSAPGAIDRFDILNYRILDHPTFATEGNSTFSIATADVDNDGDVDIVTGGSNHNIRYFQNDSFGNFTLAKKYDDPLNPQQFNYRDIEFADVDADLDMDMAVTRIDGQGPDRVWFNRVIDASNTKPGNDPLDVVTGQPDLVRSPVVPICWRLVGGSGSPSECLTGGACSYEVCLEDLNADGSKDLVFACPNSRAVAYLNNGLGFFGSQAAGGGANDGQPAYVFDPVTSYWPMPEASSRYAQSECLFEFCREFDASFDAYVIQQVLDWTDIEFSVSGVLLNVATGVAVADVDRDGLKDVAFSNRNDIQEFCLFSAMTYLYLNFENQAWTDPQYAVPPVYDYLFYNRTEHPATLNFDDQCVEEIGEANDGTGYGELVNMGESSVPEWLDANFNNVFGPADPNSPIGYVEYPDPHFPNWLFWGVRVPIAQCQLHMSAAGAPASLYVAGDPSLAGLPFVVLSSTSVSGSDDGPVLLGQSDLLTAALEGGVPGSVGFLDKAGEAAVQLVLPPAAELIGGMVWFSVAVQAADGSYPLVTQPVGAPVVEWSNPDGDSQ